MKKKRQLAKFLAEKLATYIDNMHKEGYPNDFTKEGLEPILREAIQLYELKTEPT